MKRARKLFTILFIVFICSVCGMTAIAIAPPEIKGESAIVVNSDTGQVLYGKNELMSMPPSHLTKVMTAYIATLHYDDLSMEITASAEGVLEGENLTNGRIKEGEILSVTDLMYMALVGNHADAAAVLAVDIAGSLGAFVELMNETAIELGMNDTKFVNVHGAHINGQYTTANDMATLTFTAMQNSQIAQIADTQYKRIASTNMSSDRYFFSNNALVISSAQQREVEDYYYSAAYGLMTGVAGDVGYNIAAMATKDDLTLITVVLGSYRDEETREKYHYTDAVSLFNYVYDNFKYTRLLKDHEAVGEIEVLLSGTNDSLTLVSTQEEFAIIPQNVDISDMEVVILTEEGIEAPIEKGEIMGYVEFIHNDTVYGAFEVASQSEVTRNQLLFFLDRVTSFLSSPLLLYSIIGLVVLIVLYAALVYFHNKKVKRKRMRNKRKRRYK